MAGEKLNDSFINFWRNLGDGGRRYVERKEEKTMTPEWLSDQFTDLFFVAAATKKRLPGSAKDLDKDKPRGRATATFRARNCNSL
jgi:hypothetical protein